MRRWFDEMGNTCENCGREFREEIDGRNWSDGSEISIDLCDNCAIILGMLV